MKGILRFYSNHQLVLSLGLFAGAFTFTRAPYFLWAPLVFIDVDSLDYFTPVYQMVRGSMPDFSQLPPGYPIFLFIIGLLSNKIVTIVVMQNLFSLAAGCILIYSVYRHWEKLTLPAPIVLVFYYSGTLPLSYDTSIYTESLFTSALVLVAAFLVESIYSDRFLPWLLLSLSMSAVFLIRPNGVIVIPFCLLIVSFILWNRYPVKYAVLLVATLSASILGWMMLNKLASGKSSFGMSATPSTGGYPFRLFLLPDPAYPEVLNKIIKDRLSNYDENDLWIMHHSWNLIEVRKAIDRIYEYHLGKGFDKTPKDEIREFEERYHISMEEAAPLFNRAIVDARKRWKLYIKYVIATFIQHITNIAYKQPQFYFTKIHNRYNLYYKENFIAQRMRGCYQTEFVTEDYKKLVFKELYPAPLRKIPIERFQVGAPGNYLLKAYHLLYKLNELLFRNVIWGLVFIAVFLLSAYKLIEYRFGNKEAFLLFALCSLHVFSGIVISLVQNAYPRYSYPTEFIVYFSAVLSPLLIPPFGKFFMRNYQDDNCSR